MLKTLGSVQIELKWALQLEFVMAYILGEMTTGLRTWMNKGWPSS